MRDVTSANMDSLQKMQKRNLQLPIPRYAGWLEALATDNEEYVSILLAQASRDEKDKLLYGQFVHDSHPAMKNVSPPGPKTTLIVVIAHGSLAVLKLLVNNGVDMRYSSLSDGFNIIHALVLNSFYQPNLEDRCVNTYHYISSLISIDVLRDLLMVETPSGLRAVEFAAQQSTFRLMEAIFLTKDIYVKHEERHAGPLCQLVDITEYESSGPDSRRNKSPLFLVAYLDENKLETENTLRMFRSTIITEWLRRKRVTHAPWVILWFLQRFALLLMYSIYSSNARRVLYREGHSGQNLTNNSQTLVIYCDNDYGFVLSDAFGFGLGMCILICTTLTIIFDLVYLLDPGHRKVRYRFTHDMNGVKQMIVCETFYRFNNFLAAAFIWLDVIHHIIPLNLVSHALLTMCPIFVVGFGMWGFLFFIQVMPGIGPFVVTIQRMLIVFVNFGTILVIVAVPFSYLFYMFVNTYSRQGCVDEFNDPLHALYTSFNIMINLFNINELDVEYPLVLDIIHVMFIFLVGILMLNFLIALLSDNVSSMTKNKDIYLTVQRISVLSVLEMNFGFLLKQCFAWAARKIYINHGNRILFLHVNKSGRPGK